MTVSKLVSAITEFDPKVRECIKHYVYVLRDPRTGDIFYAGKGIGNRCFAHIEEAKNNKRSTPKLDRIRDILAAGSHVKIDIVRHSMGKRMALEVEGALIDALDLKSDGNLVRGNAVDRGILPAEEVQIRYGATALQTEEPLLLLKINKQYQTGMSMDEVYEHASWCWKMDQKRAEKAEYVLAVAHGIVRGVFKPSKFRRVSKKKAKSVGNPGLEGRIYFDGVAVKSPYLFTSTKAFGQQGQGNPVRYINL